MASLAGLRVVEVALGVSAVGAGLAGSLPGSLLRDLGADVVRVRSRRRPTLDAGVESARGWDRGKEIVEVDDTDPARAGSAITALAEAADVLFVTGREDLAERMGRRAWDLARSNPRLVVVRIRPGHNALGGLADLELLVAARSGLLTQIRGRRPGPVFADLTVASAGAGLSAAVGALACLVEREATGLGGWAETSLYDGIQAILPMIIGRVEHHSPSTTLLWQDQGPAESLSYRCADGEYLQLWFGAKGAYDAFLAHMGDPPSEKGYQAELTSGAMAERNERWAAAFAAHGRDWWIADLAGQNFRCEPVWRPGEALRDPHVVQAGLSVRHHDPEASQLGPITVLGPVIRVTPAGDGEPEAGHRDARLLEGVHVLDLSAFLAGPIAPLVLAELGADVVKVEPLTGDVHRDMEPMFAAGPGTGAEDQMITP